MQTFLRSVLLAAAMAFAALPGQAQVFVTMLSGANEADPNESPGTGNSTVTLDSVAHTMRVQAEFSGLLGTVTQAHIHAPTTNPFTGTAGVATPTPTFPGFPSGVTSGTYDLTFDMTLASSYNSSFLNANGGTPASAEAALFNAIMTGRAYLNIHTTSFGAGEIRGFYAPVPGPGALAVFACGGFPALLALRRRRDRALPVP
jgi:hypothetical protein